MKTNNLNTLNMPMITDDLSSYEVIAAAPISVHRNDTGQLVIILVGDTSSETYEKLLNSLHPHNKTKYKLIFKKQENT